MEAGTQSSDLERLLADNPQSSRARCCFLLHVRTDRLEEYLDAHQHVWPDMRQALSDCGWRRYSLFVQAQTGMVVGYFEADDVDAAQRAMAATEVNARWQQTMSEFFVQPDGGTNEVLPQYFYLA
jgi:L-rhamnose mutarotase